MYIYGYAGGGTVCSRGQFGDISVKYRNQEEGHVWGREGNGRHATIWAGLAAAHPNTAAIQRSSGVEPHPAEVRPPCRLPRRAQEQIRPEAPHSSLQQHLHHDLLQLTSYYMRFINRNRLS